MPVNDDGTPPPEATVIKRARQARKMSPEDAAPLTGIIRSRRWRQIEAGHASGRAIRGDDDVIAHMAAAVGVDPAQLDEAGRGEAAEILREILRQRDGHAPQPSADPARDSIAARPGLSDRDRAIALAVYDALHEAASAASQPQARRA